VTDLSFQLVGLFGISYPQAYVGLRLALVVWLLVLVLATWATGGWEGNNAG